MQARQTVEAIYEDGVLRPLEVLEGVPEHSKVKIAIGCDKTPPHPLLQFAGILSDEEAAQLRQSIQETFGKVDPHGW